MNYIMISAKHPLETMNTIKIVLIFNLPINAFDVIAVPNDFWAFLILSSRMQFRFYISRILINEIEKGSFKCYLNKSWLSILVPIYIMFDVTYRLLL